MSTSSAASGRNLGQHLAELGSYIECARQRERHLVSDLKNLLGSIPHHFVISVPLQWQEQPATESAGACTTSTPGTGSTMTNLLTIAATVLRKPAGDCSTPLSASLPKKQKKDKAKQAEKKDKKKKSKTVKSEKKSKEKNVSELYKQFGLKSKAVSKKKSGCNSCNDSSSDAESTTSDDESCDDEVCVTGCVPCSPHVFPKLIPYAIQFNFTFTRLRGNIQGCNTQLVHTFTGDLKSKLEKKIRNAGINVSGGFLQYLPTIQTALINAYGNRGEVLNLVATINFQQGKVFLGRNNLATGSTVPNQLFGKAKTPTYAHPIYTQFGLGQRSQFLSNFFNVAFTVDLSLLSDLQNIISGDLQAGGGSGSSSSSDDYSS